MPPRYIAIPFVGGGGFQPITTPVLTATVISSSQINLSLAYTPPPSSGSFIFEQAANPAGPWTTIGSQASSAFSVTGLAQNTTYSFRGRVQVVDGRFSSYSNTATLATLASVPGQVQNLVDTNITTTTVSLTWDQPQFAQTYNLYRDGVLIASGLPLTPRTYTDTGLAPGTTYSYTVSSSNTVGEGPQSAPDQETTIPVSGGGPGNFRFAATCGHYYRYNSYHLAATDVTNVTNVLNSMTSVPKGVVMSAYPFYLVNSVSSGPDTYNFANTDTLNTACISKGKKWVLELADRVFPGANGTIPGNLAPTQWINNGWLVALPSGSNMAAICKMWDANFINNAWIPYIQAFGARYASSTALAEIQIGGESTMASTPSGFNATQYYSLIKTTAAAARTAFPNTLIHVMIDFMTTSSAGVEDMINYLATLGGMSIGGPDPEGPGPTITGARTVTANRTYVGASGSGTNYSTKLIFRSQVEGLFQNVNPISTPQNLWTLAKSTVNPQRMYWTDVSASWSNIQNLIQNGTLTATRNTAPNDGFTYI